MVVGEGGSGGGGPGLTASAGNSGTSPRSPVTVARVSTPAVGPTSRWRVVVGGAFSRVFGPGGGTQWWWPGGVVAIVRDLHLLLSCRHFLVY
jgi:hypothetical protein